MKTRKGRRLVAGGSLIAIILFGVLVGWFEVLTINMRAEHAHTDVRAMLEWNIDTYERWQQEPGRETLRQSDPASYEAQLDQFLFLHSPFRDYQAWWLTTYRGDLPPATVGQYLTADPQFAMRLREAAYLDPYLDRLLPHHPFWWLPGLQSDVYH